eukprot:6466227-Amphidinium_carterae.1
MKPKRRQRRLQPTVIHSDATNPGNRHTWNKVDLLNKTTTSCPSAETYQLLPIDTFLDSTTDACQLPVSQCIQD